MRWLMESRWRVAGALLLLLLALDAVRSVNARLGYRRATELWQPSAEEYSQLRWPPAANVRAGAGLGERVFVERCAVCHGLEGRGNGPAAPSLVPRPRDLTLGELKYKSTAAGEPPADEDLARVVRDGLRASAMPYFRDVLGPEELAAVTAHARRLAGIPEGSTPPPLDIPAPHPADEGSLERGAALYHDVGCPECHGADGTMWRTFADAAGHDIRSRDLTAPWTFRGGDAPEALWLRLTTGVGVMPSYAEALTPEQRWDVVWYVRSLARTPPWEEGGTLAGPGQSQDLLQRGEYLTRAQMCPLCHTQVDRTGIYREDGWYLAGGMRVGTYPYAFQVSRNLTSDPETGLGSWTVEQVATALRTGRTPTRLLNVTAMPWNLFHGLEDQDARAIATYLKALPPVRNQIPPPLRYGALETLAVNFKLGMPPIAPRLTYAEGNFGNPASGAHAGVQRAATAIQWLVLLAGIPVLLFFAGAAGRRAPRTAGGWALRLGAVVGAALLLFAGRILYHLPVLEQIPPEQITAGVMARLHAPSAEQVQGKQHVLAVARRGRYLYSVNCLLCHGPDGRGGMKVSWRSFGTVFSRNLSSDPETGLGSWSDEEIARAIRSGMSRDGRPLHWQAMIWDLVSSLDEEDVRALVSYLRTMPPVKHAHPGPFPPGDQDCETYTIFNGPAQRTSGCF